MDGQGVFQEKVSEKKETYRKLYSVELLLVVSGKIEIETPKGNIALKQGGTALIPAILGEYKIVAKSSSANLFSPGGIRSQRLAD